MESSSRDFPANAGSSSHRPKLYPRSILTKVDAVCIFKLQQQPRSCDPSHSIKASDVAKKYKVSPKTIRDIWNRRTWTVETRHLWNSDEACNKRPAPMRIETHRTSAAGSQNELAPIFVPSTPSDAPPVRSFGFNAAHSIFETRAPFTHNVVAGAAATYLSQPLPQPRNFFSGLPATGLLSTPAFELLGLLHLIRASQREDPLRFVPLWPTPPLIHPCHGKAEGQP
jgi:hypothetical protein